MNLDFFVGAIFMVIVVAYTCAVFVAGYTVGRNERLRRR